MMLPLRLGRIMSDYPDGHEQYYGDQSYGAGNAAGVGNDPVQG